MNYHQKVTQIQFPSQQPPEKKDSADIYVTPLLLFQETPHTHRHDRYIEKIMKNPATATKAGAGGGVNPNPNPIGPIGPTIPSTGTKFVIPGLNFEITSDQSLGLFFSKKRSRGVFCLKHFKTRCLVLLLLLLFFSIEIIECFQKQSLN